MTNSTFFLCFCSLSLLARIMFPNFWNLFIIIFSLKESQAFLFYFFLLFTSNKSKMRGLSFSGTILLLVGYPSKTLIKEAFLEGRLKSSFIVALAFRKLKILFPTLEKATQSNTQALPEMLVTWQTEFSSERQTKPICLNL